MATVDRDILANGVGAGLGMAVFVVVVPIYPRLLSAEAHGLDSFCFLLENARRSDSI